MKTASESNFELPEEVVQKVVRTIGLNGTKMPGEGATKPELLAIELTEEVQFEPGIAHDPKFIAAACYYIAYRETEDWFSPDRATQQDVVDLFRESGYYISTNGIRTVVPKIEASDAYGEVLESE